MLNILRVGKRRRGCEGGGGADKRQGCCMSIPSEDMIVFPFFLFFLKASRFRLKLLFCLSLFLEFSYLCNSISHIFFV